MTKLKFIDLFAGLGGTRIGFEQACYESSIEPECVFSSEIKEAAVEAYLNNFRENFIHGDITKIKTNDIPDFDYLLAGFPCQPFSAAGSRHGFADTRGTLFFDIERIISAKKPTGFLLENVEGLVGHDKISRDQKIGRTLSTILAKLTSLGYHVNYRVLDSKDFGVPQIRKRVYITGHLRKEVSLENFLVNDKKLYEILETGKPTLDTKFTKNLLSKFSIDELAGKSIKDKRGGSNNIHSWDLELKGPVSKLQKKLLSNLLKQRRQKKWAISKGITWMDGMPLTVNEIKSFYDVPNLKTQLEDLVDKGYLRFEHPKELVSQESSNGKIITKRVYDTNKEKGFNIVVGKLSFELNKILDPLSYAPTLVATDVDRLAVIDGKGLRKLTKREGLRLCGFPDTYNLDTISHKDSFDLLGNTVVVPVIKDISKRLIREDSQ